MPFVGVNREKVSYDISPPPIEDLHALPCAYYGD